MSKTPQRPHHLSAASIAEMAETRHVHQFNENGIRMTRSLSDATDLQRLGVHLVRLEKGRDSTTHHYHDTTEEFVYILSGRGVARINDEQFEVGAGDFMGFTAPSAPHSMHNPYDDDLVYLVGGEHKDVDVVHYPDLRRSMVNHKGRKQYAGWDDIHDAVTKS